ncbi:MAG: hypothetical protein Q8P11_01125 [bacterium]|nr:hypothetical protein [bacterium]
MFSAILLLGAGCTLKFGSSPQGGIWKTLDSGETWVSKHSVVTMDGKKQSFGNEQVLSIKVDPRNGANLFAGTTAKGLFTSTNAGETWTNTLPNEKVVDIALDADSRCVLYVLTPTQLHKTTKCGTEWTISYDETRRMTSLTSVETDPIKPEIVYLTTTKGDILKSTDRGNTWTAIYRFPNIEIDDLVIDRLDSHVIYVATRKKGIFRSKDKGLSWEDVSEPLKRDFSSPVFRWVGTLKKTGGLLFVNDDTMYRTSSMGDSWEKVPLLTPSGRALIFSVAVNPNNDDEIVYATQSTFYRTTDGGAHWISRPLPSNRSSSQLLFDPYNTATIYLGTNIYSPPSPYFK